MAAPRRHMDDCEMNGWTTPVQDRMVIAYSSLYYGLRRRKASIAPDVQPLGNGDLSRTILSETSMMSELRSQNKVCARSHIASGDWSSSSPLIISSAGPPGHHLQPDFVTVPKQTPHRSAICGIRNLRAKSGSQLGLIAHKVWTDPIAITPPVRQPSDRACFVVLVSHSESNRRGIAV